jgi:lysozyme
MQIGQKGIDLIKHFESCELNAYLCPSKIPTIGWGNTTYPNGKGVKLGDKITQKQADEIFLQSLYRYEKMVRDNIKRELAQHEFDAVCSFVYNSGTSYKVGGSWTKYQIFKNIDNNMPKDELKKYWETLCITGGGKVLNGLVKRRKSEVHLFNNDELKFF